MPYLDKTHKTAPAGSTAPVPGALPSLLFRQVLLLVFLCGVAAFRYFLPGILVLFLVFCFDWPRSRSLAAFFLLLASFGLGFGYMGLRERAQPIEPQWLSSFFREDDRWRAHEGKRPEAVTVSAKVVSVQRQPQGRVRIILDDVNENGGPGTGRFAWSFKPVGDVPLPGQTVAGAFTFARIKGTENPGVFNIESYWGDQGVWWRARNSGKNLSISGRPGFLEETRSTLYQQFVASLPRQGGKVTGGAAFLPALVFGDRSSLNQEDTDLVARATLAHSLALSGLHLGYALGLGWLAARLAGLVFPRVWLRVPRPVFSMVLGVPLAVFYLWLGKAPISLQRSTMMLVFWAILIVFRKPRAFLDGLLAAVAIFAVIDPSVIFDIRLQLSALCITAIALALPWLELLSPGARDSSRFGRFKKGLLSYIFISLAIQITLLPLSAKTFGTVGLLFPLNALWLPILGFVVMPFAFLGLGLSAFGMQGAASLALGVAALPCDLLLAGLGWLDNAGVLLAPAVLRPHWLSMAGYWLLLLSVPLFIAGRQLPFTTGGNNRKKIVVLALAGVFIMFVPFAQELGRGLRDGDVVRLRVIDVGSGQAVCIEQGSGPFARRTLVDGGLASPAFDSGRSVVSPALTDNQTPRLDTVIYSHPDSDHLGGLIYILEAFRVRRLMGNGEPATGKLADSLARGAAKHDLREERLVAGDRVEVGRELFLEVLWPPASFSGVKAGKNSNNASLVMRLVWRGRPLAILCGDVEKSGLRAIVENNEKSALTAEVLVVPHHGSAKSFLQEFMDKVGPGIGVASCGYGNMWRFPARDVRDAFEAKQVPLYVTAEDGQVLIEWKKSESSAKVVLPQKTNSR